MANGPAGPTGEAEVPTITVVIPVRNDAAALRRCLAALARQTRPAAEIVVVDNGSTDDSAAVATACGAVMLHVDVAGIPGATAAGLDAAHGAVIARLDADTVPADDWLEWIAAAFAAGTTRRTIRAMTGPSSGRPSAPTTTGPTAETARTAPAAGTARTTELGTRRARAGACARMLDAEIESDRTAFALSHGIDYRDRGFDPPHSWSHSRIRAPFPRQLAFCFTTYSLAFLHPMKGLQTGHIPRHRFVNAIDQQIGIDMTMGTGVVLFVIGAILAFAVHVQTAFISLSTAGYILMVAGVVVFLIGLILMLRGRRTVTTTSAAPVEPGVATQRTTRTTDPTEF